MAASSPAVRARRRAPARTRTWSRLGVLALLAGITVGLGLVFAGSPGRLADGTRIAGVDVGGLTPADARRLLERRSERLARVPVVFTFAGRRFRITPRELGVKVDWAAAVSNARRQGDGFAFVRGYRRLELQFFPEDLVPPTKAYDAAVDYELRLLTKAVNRPHREARLVRRGLHITMTAGATGHSLDRAAARDVLVRSLASFTRGPVGLPVRIDPPRVTVETLAGRQRTASRIVSAPVTVVLWD